MVDPNTRQAKRTPVTLKIKFKSATLDQFIERYAVDVSHGGIFIRTKEPLPVGTQMRFEFQLRDATPLITGEGTVVWTRENDPQRPGVAPGMGVRFDRLGDGSQEVLDKILAQKAKSPTAADGKPPVFNEVPTKVAPSPLVGALAAESKPRLGHMAPPRAGFADERTDMTPLPKPMPFHSDVDDFPDEAFEEATKVRSLDDLVAATAIDDDPPRTRPRAPREDKPSGAPPMAMTTLAGAPPPMPPPATAAAGSHAGPVPVPPTMAAIAAQHQADELAARRAAKHADVREPARPVAAPLESTADSALIGRDGPVARTETPRAPMPPRSAKGEGPSRSRPIPPPESMPAMDFPDEPLTPPRGAPIGIIAGLVVVAAAAAAVWFFVLREDATKSVDTVAPTPAPTETAAPTPAPQPPTPAPEPPPPAPAETADVVIASSVPGSTVEIVGTSQSGPAPFTAKLEKGKRFVARVSAPDFAPAELDVGTDQPQIKATLQAMARVVRITSTPAGAHIYVDGRDTKKNTPADIELSANEAKKPKIVIGLRKGGFEKFNEPIAKGAFGPTEGKLVASLDAQLVTARARPVPDEEPEVIRPSGLGGGQPSGGTGATPGGASPGGTPSGSPTGTPTEGSGTVKPPESRPTEKPPEPTEPKPAEPKPAEPKPAETPKGSAEPTPDWAK